MSVQRKVHSLESILYVYMWIIYKIWYVLSYKSHSSSLKVEDFLVHFLWLWSNKSEISDKR